MEVLLVFHWPEASGPPLISTPAPTSTTSRVQILYYTGPKPWEPGTRVFLVHVSDTVWKSHCEFTTCSKQMNKNKHTNHWRTSRNNNTAYTVHIQYEDDQVCQTIKHMTTTRLQTKGPKGGPTSAR